MNKIKTLIKQ